MMINSIRGLRRLVRRAAMVFATLLALVSTATAGTISFAWDPNPEPAVMGYVVYVGTAAGTYTASYDVGNATTFALTTAVPGTTYHIAVRAYGSGTSVSPLSGEITAALAAAPALPTPTPIGPAGTVTSATPAFSWAAVAGATRYALWVDDASKEGKLQQQYDAAAVGCAAGTGTCTVAPGVTLATGAGTWWVQASNATGTSAWSKGSAFTVPSVFPPAAPKLLGPAGTVSTTTPTFSWAAAATATSYTLWVDDASAQGKIQQVVSATQAGCAAGTGTCAVTPTVALATGPGTWWVKATTAAGDGPWSADQTFTIAKPTVPGTATLLGPTGTTTTTPTFSWKAVPGATSYSLWVDDAKTQGKVQQVYAAAQLGCTDGTGTCAVTPGVTLATGAGQFWVKATNALGDGPWS